MINSRRSDMEISADILRLALHGIRKSHIVYKANLNFVLAKKYLDVLLSSELLAKTTEGFRGFTTTEKGVSFIETFEGLQGFLR